MPLAATRAPYTLFIVDDDMPPNPREDYDCLGKMVCWHGRYSLGEKHDFEEPRDFLKDLLFSEYSSSHDRDNPVFAFLKSGKAKDAKLEYTAPQGSGSCWKTSTGLPRATGMYRPAMPPR